MSSVGSVPVAHTRLEHTTDGHSKFYEVVVIAVSSAVTESSDRMIATADRWRVRTEWGRIGAGGQSGTREFSVARAAAKFAQETVEEKLGKGYHDAGRPAGIVSVAAYYQQIRAGVDPHFVAIPVEAVAPKPPRNPGDPFDEADDQFFGRLRDEIEH